MDKLKEILDIIKEKNELRDLSITKYISNLEYEKFGIEENEKYLSNKSDEIINQYDKEE